MLKVIILAAGQGFRLGGNSPQMFIKSWEILYIRASSLYFKKNNQASFLDQLQTLIKEN